MCVKRFGVCQNSGDGRVTNVASEFTPSFEVRTCHRRQFIGWDLVGISIPEFSPAPQPQLLCMEHSWCCPFERLCTIRREGLVDFMELPFGDVPSRLILSL